MIKISIVVPVYNVEKYIEQCLLSCINQVGISKDEYEIIVVNDGTKDSSMDIVRAIDWQETQYVIFEQENQGLSAARNSGLKIAQGEYVWFVDSDDWIAENSLSLLFGAIKKDVDAITIGAADVLGNGIKSRFENQDLDGCVFAGNELIAMNRYSCCVPFTIYKKEFLLKNKLEMMRGVFHEDSEFSPRTYNVASAVAVVSDDLYFVRQNPTSITRTFNSKKSFDLILIATSIFNYTKNNVEHKYQSLFYAIASTSLNNSLVSYQFMNEGDKIKFKKEIQDNRKLFRSFLKSSRLKHKVQGIIFLLFGYNIIPAYKFMSFFVK